MNYEELINLLDIDTPSDLVYFEQFAELIETRQEISVEAIVLLVSGMEPDVLSELIESYFEDLLKFIPDDADDVYTLLSNIGTTLSSLAENTGEDAARVFAEELYKFRMWYLFESRVASTELDSGAEREIPLIDALTNCRVQNFTEEEYEYDFSEATDYPIEEYIMSLNALADRDYDNDRGYDDERDYGETDDEDEYDPDEI